MKSKVLIIDPRTDDGVIVECSLYVKNDRFEISWHDKESDGWILNLSIPDIAEVLLSDYKKQGDVNGTE